MYSFGDLSGVVCCRSDREREQAKTLSIMYSFGDLSHVNCCRSDRDGEAQHQVGRRGGPGGGQGGVEGGRHPARQVPTSLYW